MSRDSVAVQLSVTMYPADAFVAITLRPVDCSSMNEPGRSVTAKLEPPTAIDCRTAALPDTFNVTPPTDRTTLVDKFTSLYAARANPGRSNATIEPESKNFFMSIRYELIKAAC